MKIQSTSAKTLLALSAVTVIALSGCTTGLSGKDYGRAQTRGESEVRFGSVVDVSEVRLDGTRTGVGAAAGAVIGGIAGANGRDSVGGQLAGALGAIVGGLIGQGAEQIATKKKGIEIVVDLGNNKLSSIVQEDDGTKFAKGDKVRLTNIGGDTRVVPLTN